MRNVFHEVIVNTIHGVYFEFDFIRKEFDFNPFFSYWESVIMKKFLIFLLIVGLIGLASIPLWTARVEKDAFANPHDPESPEKVKDALLVKMRIQRFKNARLTAEKGVLFFPRCKEMPYFLYNAAKCADLEKKPKVAIYWYKKFIRRYPKHMWTSQAKNSLKKLEGLHGTPK